METQLLPCCGLFYSDAGQWISQTLLIDSEGTTLNFPHRKNAAAVLRGQQRCQLQGFALKSVTTELQVTLSSVPPPNGFKTQTHRRFFPLQAANCIFLVEPVRRLKSRINTKTWMSSWPCRLDRINCDSCFAHSNSPQPALLLVISFFFFSHLFPLSSDFAPSSFFSSFLCFASILQRLSSNFSISHAHYLLHFKLHPPSILPRPSHVCMSNMLK